MRSDVKAAQDHLVAVSLAIDAMETKKGADQKALDEQAAVAKAAHTVADAADAKYADLNGVMLSDNDALLKLANEYYSALAALQVIWANPGQPQV